MPSSPAAPAAPSDPPGDNRPDALSIIGSDADPLETLASLAPTLKEAELRIAVELASRAARNPARVVTVSSRDLAKACKIARSAIVPALDSLTARGLLTSRQGTATKPAVHQVNFLLTARFPTLKGGPVTGPPPTDEWSCNRTRVVLQKDQGGPFPGPPPPENAPLFEFAATIEFKTSNSILDRTLQARPNNFAKSDLQALAGYAYKWLILQKGMQGAHPPDNLTLAQLATAAGGTGRAISLILDNLQDRQAENCQYLVSLALQRIHGIQPAAVKRRRAELRLVHRGQAAPAAEPAAGAPDPEFSADLIRQAVAGAKSLR